MKRFLLLGGTGFLGRALCEHLKDPAQNGGKDLPALLEHVKHDALTAASCATCTTTRSSSGWSPGTMRWST